MKKTHKIIMGATALVMAFSACALSACNSNSTKEPDGTIDGNYKVATAEEVSTALSTVNQDTLLGDQTAEGYKLGIDFSSNLNLSMSTEGQSISASMSASYKMLATAGESAFSYKGAGDLSMNSSTTSEDKTTTAEMSLNLWQDDAMAYAKLTAKSSEDKESQEPKTVKIKFDASELISTLLPSDGPDTTIPTLPEDIEIPGDVTTPDLSSLDLVTALNMLNEMGATTSLDTTDGIKLKISINQDVVNSLIEQMMGVTADQVSELVSFAKCSLDFYVAIDKNGMLSATSIVADVEASANVPVSETQTLATTIKLSGYLYFAVDANVNPEVPTSLKTDITYIDMTDTISQIISGLIGNGSMIG